MGPSGQEEQADCEEEQPRKKCKRTGKSQLRLPPLESSNGVQGWDECWRIAAIEMIGTGNDVDVVDLHGKLVDLGAEDCAKGCQAWRRKHARFGGGEGGKVCSAFSP